MLELVKGILHTEGVETEMVKTELIEACEVVSSYKIGKVDVICLLVGP